MLNRTKTVLFLAMLVASTSASLANAHVRHPEPVQAGAAVDASVREVRLGVWAGPYQCITDLDRGGRDCSSGS
jgi:methionine-rich copper-binding protein CopC